MGCITQQFQQLIDMLHMQVRRGGRGKKTITRASFLNHDGPAELNEQMFPPQEAIACIDSPGQPIRKWEGCCKRYSVLCCIWLTLEIWNFQIYLLWFYFPDSGLLDRFLINLGKASSIFASIPNMIKLMRVMVCYTEPTGKSLWSPAGSYKKCLCGPSNRSTQTNNICYWTLAEAFWEKSENIYSVEKRWKSPIWEAEELSTASAPAFDQIISKQLTWGAVNCTGPLESGAGGQCPLWVMLAVVRLKTQIIATWHPANPVAND